MSRCKYHRGHRRVTQADYYAAAAGLVRDADEDAARGFVASYSLPKPDPNCPTCHGNPYWGKTLSSWDRCRCTMPVGQMKFPKDDGSIGRALGKSLHDKGFRLTDES